jgi:hypothetical protein
MVPHAAIAAMLGAAINEGVDNDPHAQVFERGIDYG